MTLFSGLSRGYTAHRGAKRDVHQTHPRDCEIVPRRKYLSLHIFLLIIEAEVSQRRAKITDEELRMFMDGTRKIDPTPARRPQV